MREDQHGLGAVGIIFGQIRHKAKGIFSVLHRIFGDDQLSLDAFQGILIDTAVIKVIALVGGILQFGLGVCHSRLRIGSSQAGFFVQVIQGLLSGNDLQLGGGNGCLCLVSALQAGNHIAFFDQAAFRGQDCFDIGDGGKAKI